MPNLKEEILLTIEEGTFYLLNPSALFRVGLPYKPDSFYKTVTRLEREGLVKKTRKEKNIYIRLTDRGENLLKRHREATQQASHHWDHLWRIVIFDIPEDKNQLRRYLRSYLLTMGFGKVQRSVWISPYDFGKEVARFARKLKIADCVFQLVVKNFRDIPEKEIANLFWDIESLNLKYNRFIRRYSEKFEELQEVLRQTSENQDILWKRFLANLSWDYQSIAARDPHLPDKLLPSDWSGKSARTFVKKSRNLFSQKTA